MPIVNRDFDISQQRMQVTAIKDLVQATDDVLFHALTKYSIDGLKIACNTLSAALSVQLQIDRFVPGAGLTTINVTSAFALSAYGTSGTITATLPAAGSTLLNLEVGDLLVVASTGTGPATDVAFSLVLRRLQDIVTY